MDALIANILTAEEVDLNPLLFRFTTDTATKFSPGKSTDCLQLSRGPKSKSSKKHFCFVLNVGRRGRLGKLCWLLPQAEFRRLAL